MKKIIVHDTFQSNYVYYLTEDKGANFEPDFLPELTPQQMLVLGIFGGKYMNDSRAEFPSDWFTHAKLSSKKDPKLNYFKVDASQSLLVWQEKGWIHPNDPRGWFQWYCRYYMGRRSTDDDRQIKRWKAMSRHVAQVQKNCTKGDSSCRPLQRQALLHWAYDARYL